jgi:hypothetical protein
MAIKIARHLQAAYESIGTNGCPDHQGVGPARREGTKNAACNTCWLKQHANQRDSCFNVTSLLELFDVHGMLGT